MFLLALTYCTTLCFIQVLVFVQSGDHLAISVLICIQTWVRNYKTILFLLAYAIFLVWLWFGWSIWFCNKTSQIVPLFCQIWTEEIYRQIAKQSHYFFFFLFILQAEDIIKRTGSPVETPSGKKAKGGQSQNFSGAEN